MAGRSPQETVERRAGRGPVRRLRGDRRRVLGGEPALGREHADHERGGPLPAADRDRHQPPRRGHQRRRGVPGRACATTRSRDVVAAAEQAAADGSPAEDAGPLLGTGDEPAFRMDLAGGAGPSWDDPVTGTEIGVFRRFADDLGDRLRRRPGGRPGSCTATPSTRVTSTFLGTSTGLRLRHDQPAGKVELNAKSADLTRSAWAGQGTRDFTDVDVATLDGGLAQRLDWAKRQDRAAGRPLRDPAAAGRRGRPAHLPVLVGRAPRTRWTAGPCSASRAAAPGSASGWPRCR